MGFLSRLRGRSPARYVLVDKDLDQEMGAYRTKREALEFGAFVLLDDPWTASHLVVVDRVTEESWDVTP